MIRYVVLVKRRADVDRDAFLRRWTEEHAALIARLPGLRPLPVRTDGRRAGV